MRDRDLFMVSIWEQLSGEICSFSFVFIFFLSIYILFRLKRNWGINSLVLRIRFSRFYFEAFLLGKAFATGS